MRKRGIRSHVFFLVLFVFVSSRLAGFGARSSRMASPKLGSQKGLWLGTLGTEHHPHRILVIQKMQPARLS